MRFPPPPGFATYGTSRTSEASDVQASGGGDVPKHFPWGWVIGGGLIVGGLYAIAEISRNASRTALAAQDIFASKGINQAEMLALAEAMEEEDRRLRRRG